MHTLQKLTLEGRSEQNLDDARGYAKLRVPRQGVQDWITARSLDEERFVATVLEKSEGNFMYLQHVLLAIEKESSGTSSWRICRTGCGRTTATTGGRCEVRAKTPSTPCISQSCACLCCERSRFTGGQVAEWTKLEVNQVLRVFGDWREFLYEEKKESEPAFRIYHGAFREFLQEEVDPGLRNYHRMIAQSALAKVRQARAAVSPAGESLAS